MAKVEKKICYRTVPVGARIVQASDGRNYAVWFQKGREMTAEYVETANGPRIKRETEVYIAYYTDADGNYRERSTRCRDRKAAEFKLQQFLQEEEMVRSGLLTPEESEVAKRTKGLIDDYMERFKEYLKPRSKSRGYVPGVIYYVTKICQECRFRRFKDINSSDLISWLNKQTKNGMGARTRNAHRAAIIRFVNWAEECKLLPVNPLRRIPKVKEKLDKRHERRAMTVEEIARLLDAAEKRPLHEITLIRRGAKAGQNLANVRPEIQEQARLLGLERKLIYAALIYTGLRKSELKSISIGQVFLDAPIPHIVLLNKDSKNGEGGLLPLHPTLVAHIRDWLELKKGKGTCDPKDKLFNVSHSLCHVLNRDLKFAGIAKKDAMDRVLDVHALRHTHCTVLQEDAGVDLDVAQKSMRHSSLDMTIHYTHKNLAAVAKGINRLPDFLADTENN